MIFAVCFSSIDYKWVCSLVVYSCSEAKRVTAVLILNHCKTLLRGSNERAVVKVIQDPPTFSPTTLNILLPIITNVQGFVTMTWSSYSLGGGGYISVITNGQCSTTNGNVIFCIISNFPNLIQNSVFIIYHQLSLSKLEIYYY